MKYCDLHTHTLHSDGTLSPADLVRQAKKAGLDAIAITDHDTVAGLPEAEKEGRRHGMEIIPGVELTAVPPRKSGGESEMHILGYFIDPEDFHLQKALAGFRGERSRRLDLVLKRLAGLGLPLERSQVEAHAKGEAVGRPHIARALVEAGHVKTFDQAFDRYLQSGRAAYVPKIGPSPAECVALIRRAGGVASVAHPRFGGPSTREEWDALVAAGLGGIEARHSEQSAAEGKRYDRLARELGLVATGGSDFHSLKDGPKGRLGDVRLPYEVVERLRALAK